VQCRQSLQVAEAAAVNITKYKHLKIGMKAALVRTVYVRSGFVLLMVVGGVGRFRDDDLHDGRISLPTNIQE